MSRDIRQCKYEGKRKVKYETEEEATKAMSILRANNFLLDEEYSIYQCKVCGKYHIGHPKKKKKKKSAIIKCEKCKVNDACFALEIVEDDSKKVSFFVEGLLLMKTCESCTDEIKRSIKGGVTMVRKLGRK